MASETPVWQSHPSVFHYTTQAGLFGILESGRLWASHFGSLNDLTEFQAITPVLRNELFVQAEQLWKTGKIELPRASDDETLKLIKAGADALPNIFWNATLADSAFGQPYVASFCGFPQDEFVRRNGLLSQWRGYGPGGGYALEFDTATIDQLAKAFAEKYSLYGLFADVIYGEQSSSYDTYRNKLQQFLNIVPIYGFVDWLNTAPENGTMQKALKLFIQLASRLKHQAFSEENEVRMVIMRISQGGELPLIPVRFRSNKESIIPYVELFGEANIGSAIRRIIVGPHHRSGERREAVQLYLSAQRVEADVIVSEIPFRGV